VANGKGKYIFWGEVGLKALVYIILAGVALMKRAPHVVPPFGGSCKSSVGLLAHLWEAGKGGCLRGCGKKLARQKVAKLMESVVRGVLVQWLKNFKNRRSKFFFNRSQKKVNHPFHVRSKGFSCTWGLVLCMSW